jgi:hypothetical protein
VQLDNGYYAWLRTNPLVFLQTDDMPGPDVDFENRNDTYFMLTWSDRNNPVLPGKATRLTSPEFIANEHTVECFSFWFYIGVRNL